MPTSSTYDTASPVDVDYVETAWCLNGSPFVRRESLVDGVTTVEWFTATGVATTLTPAQLANIVSGDCCVTVPLYTLPAFPGLRRMVWNNSTIPAQLGTSYPSIGSIRNQIEASSGRDIFGLYQPSAAPNQNIVANFTLLQGDSGIPGVNDCWMNIGYVWLAKPTMFRWSPTQTTTECYRVLRIGKCCEPPPIVLVQGINRTQPAPVWHLYGLTSTTQTVSPGLHSWRLEDWDMASGLNVVEVQASTDNGVTWVSTASLITSGDMKLANTTCPKESVRLVNVCGTQVRELNGTPYTLTANDSFFPRLGCEPCDSTDQGAEPQWEFKTRSYNVANARYDVSFDAWLYAWSVRAISGTVLLTVNGTTITMDPDETISAETDEHGYLRDDVTVDTRGGAGSRAHVVLTYRNLF